MANVTVYLNLDERDRRAGVAAVSLPDFSLGELSRAFFFLLPLLLSRGLRSSRASRA